MKTKQNEIKFYVVEVWGKSIANDEIITIPYIFSTIELARKFVNKEQENVGKIYETWTQQGAYIRNNRGQSFDDKYVE